MVLTQLVARGQFVVLPDSIVRAAGVEPGTTLVIETTEPGRIEIRVLPKLTLEEFLARFRVDAPYDEAAIREAAEDDAFEEALGIDLDTGMADGFVDTNVFIHAIATDAHSAECQQFLLLVQHGEIRVRLEPAVLHEISFMLKRFQKQMTRQDVADYLLLILGWPGVEADKIVLIDAVGRWRRTDGLAFVDAYLAERAVRDGVRIYSKNVRELRAQGAEVPDPLPARAST